MSRSAIIILAILLLISSIAQAEIEVAFSPRQGGTELIIKTIKDAKKTIRVAAYSFTSAPIAQALLDAKKHGIDVKIVLDKSNAKAKYSSLTFLQNQQVPVRVNYKYAIMHDKFMVIDGTTLQTGSFNYTKAAEEKNAENVLVIKDAGKVAQDYNNQWEKLWNEAR